MALRVFRIIVPSPISVVGLMPAWRNEPGNWEHPAFFDVVFAMMDGFYVTLSNKT